MQKNYRDLKVWQGGVDLAVLTYRLTAGFPVVERYGLQTQMRRAAVSIPSNVAEGLGRITSGECRAHLGIARGSLYELETQSILANRLRFLTDSDLAIVRSQITFVAAVLSGYMKYLGRQRAKMHPRRATGNWSRV